MTKMSRNGSRSVARPRESAHKLRATVPKPFGQVPQPLTFIDRPGLPGPLTPHFSFIDRAQASPAPNPSLLLANPSLLLANPSLLLARPLTSIGQTPHFYQPSQAAPGQTVPDRVEPCRHRAGQCCAKLDRVAVSA